MNLLRKTNRLFFGDLAFTLFNVEIERFADDAGTPLKEPLWIVRKRTTTRGKRAVCDAHDSEGGDLRDDLRIGSPGSNERIQAMRAAVTRGEGLMRGESLDRPFPKTNVSM